MMEGFQWEKGRTLTPAGEYPGRGSLRRDICVSHQAEEGWDEETHHGVFNTGQKL